MSSIATFYLLDLSDKEPALEAHRQQDSSRTEEKIVEHKFLFFRWKKKRTWTVYENTFFDYLESNCIDGLELPYSGYILITLFSDYHMLDFEKCPFFQQIDDIHYIIENHQAVQLLEYLENNPLQFEKLKDVITKQKAIDNLEEVAERYQSVDKCFREWIAEITVDRFGILELTY